MLHAQNYFLNLELKNGILIFCKKNQLEVKKYFFQFNTLNTIFTKKSLLLIINIKHKK